MTAPVTSAAESEAAQRRVAGSLARRGLREGDRMVLSVTGSNDYVNLVLGATRSGVVPVPLDPRLTAYERDRIIADVEPAVVVDDEQALDAWAGGPDADLDPWPRCRPMHFTSGTTGRPKGVWSGLLSPDAAEALVREERELWGFAPDDVNLVRVTDLPLRPAAVRHGHVARRRLGLRAPPIRSARVQRGRPPGAADDHVLRTGASPATVRVAGRDRVRDRRVVLPTRRPRRRTVSRTGATTSP